MEKCNYTIIIQGRQWQHHTFCSASPWQFRGGIQRPLWVVPVSSDFEFVIIIILFLLHVVLCIAACCSVCCCMLFCVLLHVVLCIAACCSACKLYYTSILLMSQFKKLSGDKMGRKLIRENAESLYTYISLPEIH